MRRKKKTIECIEYLSVSAPLDKVDRLEDKQSKYIHEYVKNKEFKSYHSISPKQFAQYIRFQILLEKLKTGNMRYDELALECGYYDEAHMMKGFKNYAGITIEQYRKLQEITGRNRI